MSAEEDVNKTWQYIFYHISLKCFLDKKERVELWTTICNIVQIQGVLKKGMQHV